MIDHLVLLVVTAAWPSLCEVFLTILVVPVCLWSSKVNCHLPMLPLNFASCSYWIVRSRSSQSLVSAILGIIRITTKVHLVKYGAKVHSYSPGQNIVWL